VEPETIHELTAAYALDALDPDEERVYEDHLARCDRCREELASLSETAAMLAYGVESSTPPPALRARILEQARAERPYVTALRPRWLLPTISVTAAAAVAAAIVLAVWATSLSGTASDRLSANARQAQVIEVLSQPDAKRVALAGESGQVVVAPTGEAALVLSRLQPAPDGKIYEAWVIRNGKARPAGTFSGGHATIAFPLTRPVPNGSLVAVTVEPKPVDEPTGPQVASAQIS
jgi:anti-sigma-K factor RskA